MHVAVMGAGSLGSLIGGLLASEHRVTLVGREAHVRAVSSDGLQISGEVDRAAQPAATTDWRTVEDADVGVVTVKTYDTATAASEIANNPPDTVVTLQNGLGTVEPLRTALPEETTVLAGTVTYGALLEGPGHVRCTGLGDVTVGDPAGGKSAEAERIATAFSTAGISSAAVVDMPRHRWEKLAINAAINPTTALARVQNGSIRRPPLRGIAERAAREVVAVAHREGIDLDEAGVVERVFSVAEATAENESSMARDMRRGQRTEIDAITGVVIGRGPSGEVPVNAVLYGLVVAWERDAGLRE